MCDLSEVVRPQARRGGPGKRHACITSDPESQGEHEMDAVSGVSAGSAYLMGSWSGVPITAPASQTHPLGGLSPASGSQVESLMRVYSGATANQDLVGAMLLMLTLEYLRGDDSDRDRRDFLALLALMLEHQQGGAWWTISSGSDLTVESLAHAASGAAAAGAYAGAAAAGGQACVINLVV
jgi:hypothetical protein